MRLARFSEARLVREFLCSLSVLLFKFRLLRRMKSERDRKKGAPGLWVRAALLLLAVGGILNLFRSQLGGRREGEPVEVELAVVGHLSPAGLWREAGLPAGMGEPADPEMLRERLEQAAIVESVELQKAEGRGAVRLLVKERKPVAMLLCPAAGVGLLETEVSMLLDRWGVAVPASSYVGMGMDLERLPRITVLKIPGFGPGIRLQSPAIETAVAIIAGAEGAGLGVEVREVRQMNDYSIAVDFEGGLTVQFPFEDPAGQLQKLRQLQSYSEREGRKLKTVNLVLRRNIPATFAGESAEEKPGTDVQP